MEGRRLSVDTHQRHQRVGWPNHQMGGSPEGGGPQGWPTLRAFRESFAIDSGLSSRKLEPDKVWASLRKSKGSVGHEHKAGHKRATHEGALIISRDPLEL